MNWGSCLSPEGVAQLTCIPLVFGNIRNALLFFIGTVAAFFIVLSGIKMMLHGEDAKKIEEDKKTLLFAIIGLLIVLLSFFIVTLIANLTGDQCILQFGFGSCQTP